MPWHQLTIIPAVTFESTSLAETEIALLFPCPIKVIWIFNFSTFAPVINERRAYLVC
jgi:hypothetical protein